MPAPAPNIDISTRTLDAISFVPIYPSKDCDEVKLFNLSGVALLLRSNPVLASSEITVNNLGKFPDELVRVKNSAKFRLQVPFIYAKLVSGAGDIKIFSIE